MSLGPDFFVRSPLTVAAELIGAVLHLRQDGAVCSGRIVETEAYAGDDDPASHAYRGPTPRNAVMFGPPGVVYVYFIYGVHHCLNIVTGPAGTPGAVLIRAVEPLDGLAAMMRRRKRDRDLTNGPGKLCEAFGIDRRLNGLDLGPGKGPALWITPPPNVPRVTATSRIGLSRAADRPWRFVDPDSAHLSRRAGSES